MKVRFELEGKRRGKEYKGIMIVRINPRDWLSWCREGTQVEMLATTCRNKLKKIGFDVLTMGHPQLPNQKSYPHLDFDKFLRLGLLGKKEKQSPKMLKTKHGNVYMSAYKDSDEIRGIGRIVDISDSHTRPTPQESN
jgi:hypothetical protein